MQEALDKGWLSPSSPPRTDRLVLIIQRSHTGIGIRKELGYYEQFSWHMIDGDSSHDVIAWMEYPDLPTLCKNG